LCASAEMTLPSEERERLMAEPSLRRSPVAPVPDWRSEPARSMRLMSDVLSVALPAAASTLVCVKLSWKMVCAREEVAFMFVAATVRALVPASISFAMAS
jgi:hypothetical protein